MDRMIELESKRKLQPCCGNNVLSRKEGKPDPAVFESPQGLKKAATLKSGSGRQVFSGSGFQPRFDRGKIQLPH
jgi:hypothetical protein